jgi:aminomethyltransferase
VTALNPGQSTLSCFLHPVTGGIVDDLIITMIGPEDFYVVTNAACAVKDLEYISSNLSTFSDASSVSHQILESNGLIALQGPAAKLILQEFLQRSASGSTPDLSRFYFGTCIRLNTNIEGGSELLVSRGGYTGEDGFEISCPGKDATVAVTKQLLEIGALGDRLKLAGLGARDTLRLEAGMCLYGHDLDDSTTPIEAGLKWLVAKRRIMEGFVASSN